MDCSGECFGDAYEDDCGVCDDDASNDNADMDCAGECFGDAYEDGCGECDDNPDNDCGTVTIDLDGLDLVSFHALPDDNSIGSVLGSLEPYSPGALGEGNSANFVDGQWLGTLLSIEREDGYWLKVSEEVTLEVEGLPTEPGTVYSLHDGSNLISYPFVGHAPIEETVPDHAQDAIIGIIGEGESAMNTDGGWVGWLTELSGTEGYWFITSADVDFVYNEPNFNFARTEPRAKQAIPEAYAYHQSTQQAFYYVETAEIDGETIDAGDLIIAYNGDVVVGARYWDGAIIDVPAMGADAGEKFAGYAQSGDDISFKVLSQATNTLIDMDVTGNSQWNNLGMNLIKLTNSVIPDEVQFSSAYPNPFNPVTMVAFSLPETMEVEVVVYDMLGRSVASLASGAFDRGNHQVSWDASQSAAGIYFVSMTVGGETHIQKLMLIK